MLIEGEGTHFEILRHGQPAENTSPFWNLHDPLRHNFVGAETRQIFSFKFNSPLSRSQQTADGLKVVLLPAPLAPIRVTISPLSIFRETPLRAEYVRNRRGHLQLRELP